MLYVVTYKLRPNVDIKNLMARRSQWKVPAEVTLKAEYWTPGGDIAVVAIMEAQSITPILGIIAEWNDGLEAHVYPAMTVEEGLKFTEKMAAYAHH